MDKTKNKLFTVDFLALIVLDLSILITLSCMIWGEPIPQVEGLGFLGYIGIFVALSVFNTLLERIPETVKIRR